jgi:hypothetical protein
LHGHQRKTLLDFESIGVTSLRVESKAFGQSRRDHGFIQEFSLDLSSPARANEKTINKIHSDPIISTCTGTNKSNVSNGTLSLLFHPVIFSCTSNAAMALGSLKTQDLWHKEVSPIGSSSNSYHNVKISSHTPTIFKDMERFPRLTSP